MGTGLSAEGVQRKLAVLRQVLEQHAGVEQPLEVLAALGGFEVAAMVGVVLVDGFITTAAVLVAPSFIERLQRVAQDFAQQHQSDQKLPASQRRGYTLVLGMRDWELQAFARLRR